MPLSMSRAYFSGVEEEGDGRGLCLVDGEWRGARLQT